MGAEVVTSFIERVSQLPQVEAVLKVQADKDGNFLPPFLIIAIASANSGKDVMR
jgi:hypothetical protein